MARGRLLDRFDDFVALEATGADVGALRGALEQDADPLEVRVPAALRGDHRVRAMVAEGRLLPTDCADLRHCGGQCSGGSQALALALSRANRSAISSAERTASAAFGIRASACA